MLAYDHPFVDGNGRTARALFYWQMAREKYWLIEFTSISQIIKETPAKYARAFLYTETDENDVTYFIMHQLQVIQRAIEQLHAYLARKTQELKSAAQLLEKTKLDGVLNHRQLALLENALKEPNAIYSIREHQNVHGVAYQTARTDLLMMADELNLLHKVKDGRSFIFLSPPDLRQRLEDFRNK
jgi:Fic family protein